MRPLWLALALAWAVYAVVPVQANVDEHQKRRLALVVGNSDYESVQPLKNATQDANAIADALERLGFEVTTLENVDRDDFQSAVERFSTEAEGAEATLFYFAGHGFQLNGANYLVPSDAALQSREAIEQQTLRLDWVISQLQARNRQTLVFLDACRNNPLPPSVRGEAHLDGLAQIETGSGTFVAFATQPGNVTYDGDGDNGYFADALLEHISEPGISISDMMIRVRNSVEEMTLHRQTPWDQSSLRSQFYFSPQGEGGAALTDEDRELLLSLDPELRKKFELRFGLRIESVDADVAIAEPQVPVIQAMKIESVPEPEPRQAAPEEAAPEQVALAVPEAGPAAKAPVIGALRIMPGEGEEPAGDPVAVVPLPTPRPEDLGAAEAELEPSGEPDDDEVVVARLAPGAGSARTPSVIDPVRLPSASTRAPQATAAAPQAAPAAPQAAPAAPAAPAATQARLPVRPDSGAAGMPAAVPAEPAPGEKEAVSLSPSAVEAGRAPPGGREAASLAPSSPSSAPAVSEVVTLGPVNGGHTRILGQEVSPEPKEQAVAALQPDAAEAPAVERQPAAPVSVPGAPVLVPGPQAAAPAQQALPEPKSETQIAALDPAQIRPEPIQRAPEPEQEEQADRPDDLPRAIQAELLRLGCYRNTVDGIWGSQSARALLRYYATKKESPDELEPSATLFARLSGEETVICTHTESVRPAETQRQRATPPRNERPAATSRREQPAATARTERSQQPASRPQAPAKAAGGGEGKRTLKGGLASRGVFR